MFRYVILVVALAQLASIEGAWQSSAATTFKSSLRKTHTTTPTTTPTTTTSTTTPAPTTTTEAIEPLKENEAAENPDEELLLAFVLNRHGERTPDEDELSLSNEKEKLQEYIDIDGYEGLINVGKQRVYHLGKFLRERYGPDGLKLLNRLYYHKDIALRSTNKERTKMTAEIAMAAVYPPEPEQQWGEGLGSLWQPIPYTTVPLAEDYLRFYTNCKPYKTLMAKAKVDAIHEELAPYGDLIDLIVEKTGRNFTENPTMFQTLFDLFRSQTGLGLSIPDWAEPIMPRLEEAARLGYKIYFRNDQMKKIAGGVVLNDFVQAAKDIVAGKKVEQRFHMYSSHDFNLGAQIEATKIVERDAIFPEYASLFGLELYKNKVTGKYSVLPIYLPQAGEQNELFHLHFEACEDTTYCDLDKFLTSTRQYLLTEKQFYQTCGIKTELGN